VVCLRPECAKQVLKVVARMGDDRRVEAPEALRMCRGQKHKPSKARNPMIRSRVQGYGLRVAGFGFRVAGCGPRQGAGLRLRVMSSGRASG
jgi:hypothetical protein